MLFKYFLRELFKNLCVTKYNEILENLIGFDSILQTYFSDIAKYNKEDKINILFRIKFYSFLNLITKIFISYLRISDLIPSR